MKNLKKEATVQEMPIDGLTLHDIAETTPLMTEEQFGAFVQDIETKGQLTPIDVNSNGEVFNGRHRIKALTRLGKTKVLAKVHSNVTKREMKEISFSDNSMRRHETPSQKAISAWKYYMGNSAECTQSEAAKLFGISLKQVSRVNKIGGANESDGKKLVRFNRVDIIDTIFAGGKINIGTSNKPMLTDSLASIITWLTKLMSIEQSNIIGIERRTEPTETESVMVQQICALVESESQLVFDLCYAWMEKKKEGLVNEVV